MSQADGGPISERSPLVSVIVVNLNGGAMLVDALSALRAQSWSDFEVIVVDNGSTDGSRSTVHRNFPEVRWVVAPENLGFSGGNNLGWRHARGRCLALLNNDAIPDRDWLRELVGALDREPEVAGVTSKVLLLTPFVPVGIGVVAPDAARVDGEGAGHSVKILVDESSAFLDCPYQKPIFKLCPHAGVVGRGGRLLRILSPESELSLPITAGAGDSVLRLFVALEDSEVTQEVSISVGCHEVGRITVGGDLTEHLLQVPATALENTAHDLLNNAGSELSSAGRTRDRGIFEPDIGQYDLAEDVEAICGAAVILRVSAIEQVGFFDRDFFMYFEDTDLSWRLRSHGYRLRYQPTARVRHHHAATSVEWSPLFTFYASRNKVLMLVKNGKPIYCLAAYLREIQRCIGSFARGLTRHRAPTADRSWAEFRLRLRIQLSLLHQIPRALLKRAGLLPH